MKTLFLLVNGVCNIACAYCFYTTGVCRRSAKRIHPEMVNNVADRIVSAGFDTVILTGGEPLYSFYRHDTYLLIRELKSRGLKVIMNTSATFLNDEDLDLIMSLGVDRVDISIDSHDAHIHDAQRGRHADTVWALTELIQRGYRSISTTTVVTAANAPTLAQTISWLHALGVEDARIQRVFLPKEMVMGDDVALQSMWECEPLVSLSAEHRHEYLELTATAYLGRARSFIATRTMPTCRMGKDYFVCDASGLLTLCFHRNDVVLGNLFSDPVEAVVQSMGKHELVADEFPSCFGAHCVSLFDNSTFWREKP